jgi:hypothetical protein
MYDEDQNRFTMGEGALALGALLAGGGAGRKMAGKTFVPSKAELSSLYTTLMGKVPNKTDLTKFKKQIKGLFTNPQQSLDIPAATYGDYAGAAQRAGQRGLQQVRGAAQQLRNTPVRNPLTSRPEQLALDLPTPTMQEYGQAAKNLFTNPF